MTYDGRCDAGDEEGSALRAAIPLELKRKCQSEPPSSTSMDHVSLCEIVFYNPKVIRGRKLGDGQLKRYAAGMMITGADDVLLRKCA